MKIAICDDEQEDLALIHDLLMKYDSGKNHYISDFSNADDFLAACRKENFDIALLDIEMKGTNGYDAAKLLSLEDNHPLMIFVTNNTAYSLKGYGVVFRYLTKPITLCLLSEVMDIAIREVLANSFLVLKNKLCKRNNRQIFVNTEIAAKQGNAEERPDAGYGIKR